MPADSANAHDAGAGDGVGSELPAAEPLRFLSGLILVSEKPERLVAFYRDILGVPLADENHGGSLAHWGCELGDVHFAIHPDGDYPGEPTAVGAVKIAFMVFELDRLLTRLDAAGVPLCYPPEPFGEQSRITAARDPDGNLVELTELGPSWLDYLERRRASGEDLVAVWRSRRGRD